ncbi:MAG: hypothetical protein ACT4NU_11320 [Chromatiales bacterium]
MRGRQGKGSPQTRQTIAQMAARLLVEDGELTFSAARRKAQERLGHARSRDLPDYADIEAALMDHLRLFGGEAHVRRLSALRRQALDAMRLLSPFEPHLVGPVLSGTAGKHTRVSLHVFAATVEEVTLFLEEHGIPFRLSKRRYRHSEDAHPLLSFVAGDTAVELVIFPPAERHRSPPSEIDGRPMPRADLADVQALLDTPMPGVSPATA